MDLIRFTAAELELDVAPFEGEDLAHAIVAMTADLPDVTYRITALVGEGGGWPTVTFHGPVDQLERLESKHFAPTS